MQVASFKNHAGELCIGVKIGIVNASSSNVR